MLSTATSYRACPFLVICAISIGVFLAPGCSGGVEDVARAVVSGQVTFDGEPVESGVIRFVPVEGVEGAPVQLAIKAGSYSSADDAHDDRGVVIGMNEVRILATKTTGKQVKNPMGEMEAEVLQYIPAKYNEESELKEEIESGDNTFDFELVP